MDGINNSSEEDDDNYDGDKIFCILEGKQYSHLYSTSMIIPSISCCPFPLENRVLTRHMI